MNIRFNPSMIPLGPFNSTMILGATPCNLITDVNFVADRKSLTYAMNPTAIDFGITAVGKKSYDTALFENKNSVDVQIRSVRLDPPTFPGYVTTNGFPKRVAANMSLPINFYVAPPDTLAYQGMLCVEIDSPCTDELCIPVKVEAAWTCLALNTTNILNKRPGQSVTIPIEMNPSSKFTSTKLVNLTVSYNKELLRFSSTPTSPVGRVSNVTHSDGEVSFTIDSITTLASHVADIYVEALLAPYATGMIGVSSSMFTLSSGEKIEGGNCPSPFSLGHDCVLQDELRHRSSVVIEGIYPNPSHGTTIIVVNADGSPIVKIDVFDAFGRRVEVLHDGLMTNGKHELSITTEQYSNGIYFCRIIQDGKVISCEFNVQR